jgi:AraC-like DNA-binding protein
LQPYINRIWSREYDAANVVLPKLAPGTGLELIFHFGSPFTISGPKLPGQKTPQSHIICLRQGACNLEAKGPVRFIAIRFKAGAFRHFCDIPLGELNDSIGSLQDIWGASSLDFAEKVLEAPDLTDCIHIIESYLFNFLSRYRKDDPEMDRAIQNLYYNHQAALKSEFAEDAGISLRHFQRKFKAAYGISPKYFQRLARLQTTIKELMLTRKKQYLDTALANGYYDQNHFIKDFKSFIGEEPGSFLQERNFMSHFYYR